MVTFSEPLVTEYKAEMLASYGVSVSDAEAQSHLRSLVRSLFPTVLAEQTAESREQGAMSDALAPTCAGSLSAMIREDEVGASITPTSGHRDK